MKGEAAVSIAWSDPYAMARHHASDPSRAERAAVSHRSGDVASSSRAFRQSRVRLPAGQRERTIHVAGDVAINDGPGQR